MNINRFTPPFLLRNAYVQSILASSKIRTWGANPMRDSSQTKIIQCQDGIRLLGAYSKQSEKASKGLLILLHGWEGSIDSTYILTTGRFFYQNGFDIFRLNFRDHGDSHHLNQGIFYAILLEEVFQAVKQVAELNRKKPVFLAGFSLGGNFILRILKKSMEDPIDAITHAVSISPVLDPDKATDRIDASFIFRRYFLNKWRHSLRIKQSYFPEEYNFEDVLSIPTLRAMTDVLLNRYSNYPSSKKYFKGYTVVNDAIKDIQTPLTILTASDDPIIPVRDFYDLVLHPNTELSIQPYGGHNGFLSGITSTCWYHFKMLSLFRQYV
jgi:predicted alpha/beta-fold hydrolase